MQQQEPQRPDPDLIDDLITLGWRAIRLGQQWEQQVEHALELKKAHSARVEAKVAAIKRNHRWRKGRPVPPAMKKQFTDLAGAPLPSAFRKAIDAERATAAEGREVIDSAIEVARHLPGEHGRLIIGDFARLRSFWWAGAKGEPYIDELAGPRLLSDYLTDIAKGLSDLRAAEEYRTAGEPDAMRSEQEPENLPDRHQAIMDLLANEGRLLTREKIWERLSVTRNHGTTYRAFSGTISDLITTLGFAHEPLGKGKGVGLTPKGREWYDRRRER